MALQKVYLYLICLYNEVVLHFEHIALNNGDDLRKMNSGECEMLTIVAEVDVLWWRLCAGTEEIHERSLSV
jgi:hypothetical protein